MSRKSCNDSLKMFFHNVSCPVLFTVYKASVSKKKQNKKLMNTHRHKTTGGMCKNKKHTYIQYTCTNTHNTNPR